MCAGVAVSQVVGAPSALQHVAAPSQARVHGSEDQPRNMPSTSPMAISPTTATTSGQGEFTLHLIGMHVHQLVACTAILASMAELHITPMSAAHHVRLLAAFLTLPSAQHAGVAHGMYKWMACQLACNSGLLIMPMWLVHDWQPVMMVLLTCHGMKLATCALLACTHCRWGPERHHAWQAVQIGGGCCNPNACTPATST